MAPDAGFGTPGSAPEIARHDPGGEAGIFAQLGDPKKIALLRSLSLIFRQKKVDTPRKAG